VAARKHRALRAAKKLASKGKRLAPVQLEGRTIAKSFWGKAWCTNLQSYSDYSNRLPRGTSYLRQGAVIDLQIGPGVVNALVSGSDVYRVTIEIRGLAAPHWDSLKRQCAGQIGSLVDLLRGQLSPKVMEMIARPREGLFPAPAAIAMDCSCPDGAIMCKHVAAVLYGVGARLDTQPELLFVLRKVDHLQLIGEASMVAGRNGKGKAGKNIVGDTAALESVFGIELADAADVRDTPTPSRVDKKPVKTAKAVGKPKVVSKRTTAAAKKRAVATKARAARRSR
jgi:uncharacterized Zn finger protein